MYHIQNIKPATNLQCPNSPNEGLNTQSKRLAAHGKYLRILSRKAILTQQTLLPFIRDAHALNYQPIVNYIFFKSTNPMSSSQTTGMNMGTGVKNGSTSTSMPMKGNMDIGMEANQMDSMESKPGMMPKGTAMKSEQTGTMVMGMNMTTGSTGTGQMCMGTSHTTTGGMSMGTGTGSTGMGAMGMGTGSGSTGMGAMGMGTGSGSTGMGGMSTAPKKQMCSMPKPTGMKPEESGSMGMGMGMVMGMGTGSGSTGMGGMGQQGMCMGQGMDMNQGMNMNMGMTDKTKGKTQMPKGMPECSNPNTMGSGTGMGSMGSGPKKC